MASPNAIFTELASTTYRNHSREIKDNVSHHNALLRRLNKKGRKRVEDGGLSIVTPLDYAMNGTYTRYSSYDVLSVVPWVVISAAEYPWKQIAVNVTASGLEMRSKMGSERIINFVTAKLENAIRTFKNNFSADVYSDGTLTNQINGLQVLVADSGLGIVGGIDSSAFPFWKNKVQSFATPLQGGAAVVPGPTTMEIMMQNLYYAVTRGDDQPDLIVMSNDYFGFFEQSQTSLKRYASDVQDPQAGFTGMRYKNADVFFDSGSGIPAAHGYFLNTDFLELVVHRDADMTEFPELHAVNQDAVVMPILWQGNLVTSARMLEGVLKA